MRKGAEPLQTPIRYFLVNRKTSTMHIFGFCPQTKPRTVPIRLFDSRQELEAHAGRPLHLCIHCRRALEE